MWCSLLENAKIATHVKLKFACVFRFLHPFLFFLPLLLNFSILLVQERVAVSINLHSYPLVVESTCEGEMK